MTVEKIQVPDLGDSDGVEVIEILISVGDEINENDSLLVLETDKAAMEIPAPQSGVVKEILVKVGDQVSQGNDIVILETAGEAANEQKASVEEDTEVSVESEKQAEQSPEPVVAAPVSSTELIEVKVPDLGEDGDVDVIEILVSEGDEIQADDGLITLETDKAAMEVPSPAAGKIVSITIKVGDKVSQGSVIMNMETTGSVVAGPATVAEPTSAQISSPAASAPSTAASNTAASKSAIPTPQSTTRGTEIYAGPAVRKLARELGVDLSLVIGSGIKSRIVKEDVFEFVKANLQGGTAASASGGLGLPVMKDIDFSQFGETEEVAMSKLHQLTAQNMSKNWLTVPHVTQFDEVDVTDLEEFRAEQKGLSEKKGIKLTPVPFIIKACAQALTEYPQFNVSMHSSGSKLIQKKYVNIGIAVATPAGLMVPVIKNADQKSIWQIAAEVAELGAKAKDRKLTKEDMEGGCFTISSLGGLGGTGFTPIVNSPEVGILGVSKTSIKPVYIDGEFQARKMMPYSLSYDHRAVNGMDGGLFCTYLTSLLSDIRLMVL